MSHYVALCYVECAIYIRQLQEIFDRSCFRKPSAAFFQLVNHLERNVASFDASFTFNFPCLSALIHKYFEVAECDVSGLVPVKSGEFFKPRRLDNTLHNIFSFQSVVAGTLTSQAGEDPSFRRQLTFLSQVYFH